MFDVRVCIPSPPYSAIHIPHSAFGNGAKRDERHGRQSREGSGRALREQSRYNSSAVPPSSNQRPILRRNLSASRASFGRRLPGARRITRSCDRPSRRKRKSSACFADGRLRHAYREVRRRACFRAHRISVVPVYNRNFPKRVSAFHYRKAI